MLLELNEKDQDGGYPLLFACKNDNIDIVRTLIECANDTDVTLILNDKYQDGSYPLLHACSNNNSHLLKINEQQNDGNSPMIMACSKNNTEIIKFLFEYAFKKKFVLRLNEKNKEGKYPLLISIEQYNNIEMSKVLLDYAKTNHFLLKFDENDLENNSEIPDKTIDLFMVYKDTMEITCKENSKLSKRIQKMKTMLLIKRIGETIGLTNTDKYNSINDIFIEMVEKDEINTLQLFFDCISHDNITININEIKVRGWNSLNLIFSNNDMEMLQFLIDYANSHDLTLEINERDQWGNYPLLLAIKNKKSRMIIVLTEYAREEKIILELDEKDMYDTENNTDISYEIIRLLNKYEDTIKIVYQTNSRIIEKLNKLKEAIPLNVFFKERGYDEYDESTTTDIHKIFIDIIKKEDIAKLMLFFEYVSMNDIKININEIDSNEPCYLLVMIFSNNNSEIVHLLIDYSDENDITLEVNEKDNMGNYPLLSIIKNKNLEMLEVLGKYAKAKNIILQLDENDLENSSEISDDMIERFIEIEKENKMKIIYKNNSELFERINKWKEKTLMNMISKEIEFDHPNTFESINDILMYILEKKKIDQLNSLFEKASTDHINIDINNEKNSNTPSLLYLAFCNNNVEMVQSLIDYSHKNDTLLEINKRDMDGNYPLLVVIQNKNMEILEVLVKYAMAKNIILQLNESVLENSSEISDEMIRLFIEYGNEIKIEYKKGNSELLKKINNQKEKMLLEKISKEVEWEWDNVGDPHDPHDLPNIKEIYSNIIKTKNIKVLKLFFEYGIRYNIKINFTEINEYHLNPLYIAFCDNNIEIIHLFMDYANKNNIVLSLNEINNEYQHYPLEWSCLHNNIEIVQLLIENEKANNTILKLNEKGFNGNSPVMWACIKNNTEMVQLLIEYANKNEIGLELNEKNKLGNYLLFEACSNNNIEIVHLLINYANKNGIIIDLNEKSNKNNYPVLWACAANNLDLIQLLMDYASKTAIVLELNAKDDYGNYPLLWAINKNKNIEMIRILMEYAKNKSIILTYEENDRENISGKKDEINELLKAYQSIIDIIHTNKDEKNLTGSSIEIRKKDESLKREQEIKENNKNEEKDEDEEEDDDNDDEIEKFMEKEIYKKEERENDEDDDEIEEFNYTKKKEKKMIRMMKLKNLWTKNYIKRKKKRMMKMMMK
ncbi:hypothetical protein PIROE2DRAFT_64312 [Piromyces sp. E2]|nr:hypothetical protein PIROE2DRAFT_64312 [Piromyces sp. E2]|eukprot:OUM58584.1 hypothetical protein PIROE2DRAFT_64312 [Piromyces sp. E2]